MEKSKNSQDRLYQGDPELHALIAKRSKEELAEVEKMSKRPYTSQQWDEQIETYKRFNGDNAREIMKKLYSVLSQRKKDIGTKEKK
jgi:hypothetical protein